MAVESDILQDFIYKLYVLQFKFSDRCLITIILFLHVAKNVSFPRRHRNANHPNNPGEPRQLKRPDGEPGAKQRPSCVHVAGQPPSDGPTPPTAQLQPAADAQHSAEHAESVFIERPPEPRFAKLLVERSGQCAGVAASVTAAAAAATAVQPQLAANSAAKQPATYAAANAGQEIVVAKA